MRGGVVAKTGDFNVININNTLLGLAPASVKSVTWDYFGVTAPASVVRPEVSILGVVGISGQQTTTISPAIPDLAVGIDDIDLSEKGNLVFYDENGVVIPLSDIIIMKQGNQVTTSTNDADGNGGFVFLANSGADQDGEQTKLYLDLSAHKVSKIVYTTSYQVLGLPVGLLGLLESSAPMGLFTKASVLATIETQIDDFRYNSIVKNDFALSASGKISGVEIFNVNGQLVKSVAPNANQATLNLSQLSKGMYLVRVKTNDGVKTLKIVKQ